MNYEVLEDNIRVKGRVGAGLIAVWNAYVQGSHITHSHQRCFSDSLSTLAR
jgi:hypothetical protein